MTALRSYCNSCGRSTQHEIIAEHTLNSDPDDYPWSDTWQLVRCNGCLTPGFRRNEEDLGSVFQDEYGEYQHETTISIYPKIIKHHKSLGSLWLLPPLIKSIYQQTLTAYGEEAYILASIGLRATIEAVCNHLEIGGHSLEKRIDSLFRLGHVSNADKRRLHAIRFLGNDAAHDIKEPKESDLRIALEIVEHLLNTLFILEKRSQSLDLIVENYDEFQKILQRSIRDKKIGDTLSLTALLDNRRRLVGPSLSNYEQTLLEKITNGEFDFLTIAPKQTIESHEVNMYTIAKLPNRTFAI